MVTKILTILSLYLSLNATVIPANSNFWNGLKKWNLLDKIHTLYDFLHLDQSKTLQSFIFNSFWNYTVDHNSYNTA